MAVTKTHPIKSTLKLALDYICNPEKTDEKLLASSYACSIETADIEFEWTRKLSPERGTHLGRHLIQSFAPGETTSEQAHEIGMQLANDVLGRKYEFVLTTHIDRGHIHNHLIFNSVSFVDHKKYHSNKQSYYFIRRTSDRLCAEHGLSVIQPGKDKGKSYIEYIATKNGTSWKVKLKSTIDMVILQSLDYDDFLNRMKRASYEVKRGKYVSFRADGQERFIRSKTLGENYTEENITERIKNKSRKKPKNESKRINLLIDIQNSIKAQESKGYEHWAKINNLKQASKTLNFLTEHGIGTYEELESKVKNIHNDFENVSVQIKDTEKQMSDTAIVIKNLDTYARLKPLYEQYRTCKNKDKFKRKYQSEIILFETAARELKQTKPLPLDVMKKSYSELSEDKAKLYMEYKKLKKLSADIDVIKSNVDTLLGASHKPAPEISTQLE